MEKKDKLELFYILPYTKSYNSGGYYRSDETCSIAYTPPSESVCNGNPLVFDDEEQLLNWFYKNSGKTIPAVYKIKYIDNYLGLDDVFLITNLKDNKIEYYTALSDESYAMYDANLSKLCDKNVWVFGYEPRYAPSLKFRFEYIYKEFINKGIEIKFNVYEQAIDRKNHFEYIGDPYYEREAAKGKKLVLYKPCSKSCW